VAGPNLTIYYKNITQTSRGQIYTFALATLLTIVFGIGEVSQNQASNTKLSCAQVKTNLPVKGAHAGNTPPTTVIVCTK
jgi:hypothetical protein